MLQRAASNACSWWWASHIRTKQSKWLEQSMMDMEEKVQNMLKLIEEDGDSFAKRAEMYYKRRPEIISSVEESYRAFKALADRYDMLSKELQNANHTIATVFPEQIPSGNTPNVPKVPKAPMENLKGLLSTATKPFQVKKSSKGQKKKKRAGGKYGMSKEEAVAEIEKLHKETLALQTVKEFVKSSYESGLAKYWEIENQIMAMQDKVCRMQDEFDVEIVIEDNEARTLMAEAALKSCQETLSALEEKQEQSTREAEEEFKKIESARELLKSLRRECIKEDMDEQKTSKDDKAAGESECALKDVSDLVELTTEIDPLDGKSITPLDLSSMDAMTVTELAEKIDGLVNKVISFETAVSSQTVLINSSCWVGLAVVG
ncbi:UNVERIFIED_CONTAM: Kinase-interacting protein 1 [Sesamum radiatum]|uniref:Kinase-interacting protein 1 n=1 Tax=Sesamum radiatum TaxID=300843 RepID=A0AAW2VV76_SESRA